MEVIDAPPHLYPLSIMQGLEKGSSGRNPHSQSFYTCPRPPFLLHKRQTWHNYVSDNCAHVCMATQPPVCLPDTQAWTSCAHSLVLGNYTFIFFPAFCSK